MMPPGLLLLLFWSGVHSAVHHDEPADPSEADAEVEPAEAAEDETMADAPVDLERTRFVPGKGLTFSSADDRFGLTIGLRVQFLYALEHDAAAGHETSQGIQIRRARVKFNGHVFGEHNHLKMELAVAPRDLGFEDGRPTRSPLLDAYAEFDHLRDLTLRVGQYKVPYSRQRVVSSGDLQLVDRSIASAEFNLDRDVGLDIRSNDLAGVDRLRYYAGVYTGDGRDQYQLGNEELMYIGRFEVLPMGMFEDYEEVDFARSPRPRLSLGAAYAFIHGALRNQGILGSVPTDGGTTDYHNVTADFVFKWIGLSVLGEFFYRHGFRDYGDATLIDRLGLEILAPREAPRNGLGWFVQTGYLLPRTDLEIAARFSQIEGVGDTSLPDTAEVGGGLSYYFAQHAMKLQGDYFHIWQEDITEAIDQVRLQLQISF